MKRYKDCYYVCLYKGRFAGYVGVIKDDIRICVVPDMQHKGIGRFMLNEIMEVFPNATAKIKVGNKASLRLFENAGFSVKYFLLEK
jgi:GNAT superfamily N-acetyltransferase